MIDDSYVIALHEGLVLGVCTHIAATDPSVPDVDEDIIRVLQFGDRTIFKRDLVHALQDKGKILRKQRRSDKIIVRSFIPFILSTQSTALGLGAQTLLTLSELILRERETSTDAFRLGGFAKLDGRLIILLKSEG